MNRGTLTRPHLIGVVGGGVATAEGYEAAREIGRGIARAGGVLVCGGLGGIMEGASRGCREAGGTVIGLLPGDDPRTANPFVTLPVVTGMGHARNVIIVQTAAAVIAVEGEWGTLSEMAIARKLGRPLVVHRCELPVAGTLPAATPVEAVALAFGALGEEFEPGDGHGS